MLRTAPNTSNRPSRILLVDPCLEGLSNQNTCLFRLYELFVDIRAQSATVFFEKMINDEVMIKQYVCIILRKKAVIV